MGRDRQRDAVCSRTGLGTLSPRVFEEETIITSCPLKKIPLQISRVPTSKENYTACMIYPQGVRFGGEWTESTEYCRFLLPGDADALYEVRDESDDVVYSKSFTLTMRPALCGANTR